MFALIRSFREADFELYKSSLDELIPYFFANNNTNYARWLPIHLRDMLSIENQHPDVAREFKKGNFAIHKSPKNFSSMAIDQAHEQNNAIIKGDGGAIGLTEDPSALRRWTVAGPEVSRLLAEYENSAGSKTKVNNLQHHEQNLTTQRAFYKNVKSLTTTLEELGNPFQEETTDLLTLDTKDIADPTRSALVATHHTRGKEQYTAFLNGLAAEEFYQPIKKNMVAFFKHAQVPTTTKEKELKADCQLFSRLFISCQSRQCDLEEFFRHENQSAPASLSDNGKLHVCQKSQLVEVLEREMTTTDVEPRAAQAIIIDGSALVNALPPRTKKTFDAYASEDVLPKVEQYANKYGRADVIFDVYDKSSLKAETRSKRGKGIRRKVSGNNKAPTNWKSFLRDDGNKAELFRFLAEKMRTSDTSSTLIATKDDVAVCNKTIELHELSPCSHEEADTRIFVHARHAAMEGITTLVIKANDTDVVAIGISTLPVLQALGLQQMWIDFGQGSSARWIPIHDIASAIGAEKVAGMSFFHAFTGCDVVSAFRGRGKKSAWQTWSVCEDVTTTFARLSQKPAAVDDDDLQILEKFVVALYDRSSSQASVNEARLDLFARKQRSYDSIPPTQAALREHVKRAAYQGGVIWGQATVAAPALSSPAEWGWVKKGALWNVLWTTLPPIAASCQELTRCACKKGCSGRCKCYRSGLPCTALCGCTCED